MRTVKIDGITFSVMHTTSGLYLYRYLKDMKIRDDNSDSHTTLLIGPFMSYQQIRTTKRLNEG